MKLTFTSDEHIQLLATYDEFNRRPDIQMNNKEARTVSEIIKRLNSGRRTNVYKKDLVESMRSLIHQILEHRESLDISELSEDEQQMYAMSNNIYISILDKLNKKVGKNLRDLEDIAP